MARPKEWTRETEDAALERLRREHLPVALYVRQSKTDYDKDGRVIGVSLDQQESDGRRMPEVAGCPVEVFRDPDRSGKDNLRKGVGRALVECLRSGEKAAVVCYNPDRLTRSDVDFFSFMAEMEERGILVLDTMHEIRNADKLGWKIRAIMAQDRRERIGRDIRNTLRYKKEQGWVGGHVAIGYLRLICTHRATNPNCNCPDNRLVVDPEWAPRVVVIFELYATGRFSFETLARHVNDEMKMAAPERRWRTKGEWHSDARWHVDGLKNMLNSPTYIGRTHIGRNHAVEQRDATHQAIIPLGLWQQCQAVRELNKRRKQAYRRKGEIESGPVMHALSGLLRCGRCGGAMHHQPGRGGQHWYRCAASYKGKTCDQRWIPAPELEDAIRHSLVYVAVPDQADPASIKRLAAKLPEIADPKQAYRGRLKKIDEREERIKFMWERGDLDQAEYVAKMSAIKEDRLKARMELEQAPQVDVASGRDRLTGLVAEWDAAAKAGNALGGVRRNQIVREVFERIEVDRDHESGMMVTVTPAPTWAGVFKIVLVPPGRMDTVILAVSEMRGSGAQTNARAPMLPVNPWA